LQIAIRVDAEDDLHNASTGYLSICAEPAPTITSIVPDEGRTEGGTSITVNGQSFICGSWKIAIDGVLIDSTISAAGDTITGITRAHIPGGATVTVSDGDTATSGYLFTFIPPPIVKLVDPPRAPATQPTQIDVAGNGFRPETQFYWAQDATQGGGLRQPIPLVADSNLSPTVPYARLITPFRATLFLLPGSGTITIGATDPVSGDSQLANAFTFGPAP
jgi:hypothetical protein